jgi:hypothetical protein
MEVFDTAAQRDAQWATPHDGALAYTLDTQLAWLRQSGAWKVLASATRYVVRGYRNAAFSAVAGQQTIAIDGTSFDPQSMISGGQIAIPAAGYYQVGAAAAMTAGAAGDRMQSLIYQNGAVVSSGGISQAAVGAGVGSAVADVIHCASGDHLQLGMWTLNAKALTPGAVNTFISAALLQAG